MIRDLKTVISSSLSIIPVLTLLLAIDAIFHRSHAVPVIYDFTVNVTQGSLSGNTFCGSFSFDDEVLSEQNNLEAHDVVIGVDDGLTVTMMFLGQEYSETADVDYPMFPTLTLTNHEVQTLDFWIEPGDRLVWWNTLPGWEIELSQRETVQEPIQTICE